MKAKILLVLCVAALPFLVSAATFSDDFNRGGVVLTTDASNLGSSYSNSVLRGNLKDWGISSNQLIFSSPDFVAGGGAVLSSTAVVTSTSTAASSFTVSADVSVDTPNRWVGVAFNYQDNDNFYAVRVSGAEKAPGLCKLSYQFLTIADGATAAVVNVTTQVDFSLNAVYSISTSYNANTGNYTFAIRDSGGTKLNVSDTVAGSGLTAAFQDGYAGLYSSGTNMSATYDNFAVSSTPEPTGMGVMLGEDQRQDFPNFMFITADDLNFDSVGAYGCDIAGLTPNIDRLAESGLRFRHAYSAVSLCAPVRATMHTGLYPHRNGAVGFYPIRRDSVTLNERLHEAGYFIGMIGGKHSNYVPYDKYCVDFTRKDIGRHPSKLASATSEFLETAKRNEKPFFLQINCNDPHRPFIGAKGLGDLAGGEAPSRVISVDEVQDVPGFLEDLPGVREELAQYYTNVRRLDDVVGSVLDVLGVSGLAEETIVIFYGGDHGMAFPFAKGNSYVDSLRGGLIIRAPGVTDAGQWDESHFVSTVDFTPTILEAAGCKSIANIDGRSFWPAVTGEELSGDWREVFTFFNQCFAREWYPMRGVIDENHVYIWNEWSDGKRQFGFVDGIGPQDLAWSSMVNAAGPERPGIYERIQFMRYRDREEFYVLENDPYQRNNRINDEQFEDCVEGYRVRLLNEMRRSGDPLSEAYAQRENIEALAEGMNLLEEIVEGVPHMYPPFNK